MFFSLATPDFAAALAAINHSTSGKGHTYSGYVLLTVKDRRLHLVACNTETQSSISVPVIGGEDGEAAVPFDRINAIVSGADKGGNLSLRHQDGKMMVKVGRSRFTLASLPSKGYPMFGGGEPNTTARIESRVFRKALHRCTPAMATDDVRYYLNGAHVILTTTSLTVETTDGHRAMRQNVTLEAEQVSVPQTIEAIIPASVIKLLLSALPDSNELITLGFNGTSLHIQTALATYCTKLIDGKFPEFARILHCANQAPNHTPVAPLIAALKRVSPLLSKIRSIALSRDTEGLRVEITDGGAGGSDDGVEYVEGCPLTVAERIKINADYLKDALCAFTDTVDLRFNGPQGTLFAFDPADGGFVTLVMPLRD